MADYFYSLEMLVQRALFNATAPVRNVPCADDLANEENQ